MKQSNTREYVRNVCRLPSAFCECPKCFAAKHAAKPLEIKHGLKVVDLRNSQNISAQQRAARPSGMQSLGDAWPDQPPCLQVMQNLIDQTAERVRQAYTELPEDGVVPLLEAEKCRRDCNLQWVNLGQDELMRTLNAWENYLAARQRGEGLSTTVRYDAVVPAIPL